MLEAPWSDGGLADPAARSGDAAGGRGGGLAAVTDPAMQAQLELFVRQYPLDESATNYLVNSPEEVQLAVMEEFSPPRQGESDYSALLISFARRQRDKWQRKQSGQTLVGSGAAIGEAELQEFEQRYPLDDDARNYLASSSLEVQRAVLQEFCPPRQGESDYSALLISFTKRRREASRQLAVRQPPPQPMQQLLPAPHARFAGAPNGSSFSPAHQLPGEIERFVRTYPLDESAYNYLLSSPVEVQWRVLREFSPPRQGEADYSALFMSFAKRLRASTLPQAQPMLQQPPFRPPPPMFVQQPPRQFPVMMQQQPLQLNHVQVQQQRPAVGPRLTAELEKFKQQYPLDERACSYLSSSPPEVQWAVLQEFQPPRQGESDYSALLMHFVKRRREDAQRSGPQPQASAQRLAMEIQRFEQQFPLDEAAHNYLVNSSVAVQWQVMAEFSPPNQGQSDYSALLISFTKRLRQGQPQQPMHALALAPPAMAAPAPAVRHFGGGLPGGRPPAPQWGGPPPRASAQRQPQQQRGPPVDIRALPMHIRQFIARYPIDDDSIHYLLSTPDSVQAQVLEGFKPPREGERDYSPLFISFAKRCRTAAAAHRSLEEMPFRGGHAVEAAADGDFELEAFRQRFPMDDNAYRFLAESPLEVRRQVFETFVPKRLDDTNYSAPVMAYVKVCRARAPPRAAAPGPIFGDLGLGSGMEGEVAAFVNRYPVDARAREMLAELPVPVCQRVLQEFQPKREGESDYSAAVVAFMGVCKRSFGMFVGSHGGGPHAAKRPRLF